MQIICALPPNFEAIDAVFHIRRAGRRKVYYCYGSAIYNPDGCEIAPQLITHEEVHMRQQLAMGVENWWDSYLLDKQFRLEQEIVAHRVEWDAYLERAPSRLDRRKYIAYMSERLSGGLYGNMITKSQAKREILAGTDE